MSPSSTASRVAPSTTSATLGKRQPVGRRDDAAVHVEPDRRLQHVAVGDVHGRVETGDDVVDPPELRTFDEHRAHGVARLGEAADGDEPLGDEDLVALALPPGTGVGEIDEVGETLVGRIGDLLDDRRAHVNGSA